MPLTRAQLLSGNSRQGVTLAGQVQGVTAGAGIVISPAGQISVDFANIKSYIETNNIEAFNGYFWPNETGAPGNFLQIQTGNVLKWVSNPVQDLIIVNSGSISGTPYIGQTLTYTPGLAIGGTGPYTYTWEWKDSSGNSLQTGGSTFVLTAAQEGLSIYVQLTATDSASATVTSATAPTSVVSKQPFPGPNPAVLFPTNAVSPICWEWSSANSTLSSNGCLEFKVNSGAFGQGPTPVVIGDTICAQWINGATCDESPTGSIITGCYSTLAYQECGSLTLNRVPNPFVIPAVESVLPGEEVTSAIFTPQGYNATAYVTCPSTTGTNVEGSVDGGTTWNTIPTSGDTFPIIPGDPLVVRMTVGNSPLTTYTAEIAIGEGISVNSAIFSVSTSSNEFPSPIYFPSTIPGTAVSPSFDIDPEYSPTELTATGCIEFEVNGGGFSQGPTEVAIGDIITTQWIPGTPCGDAVNGTTITGSITNDIYEASGSLTINRVPQAFSFPDVDGQPTSTLVTSGQEVPSEYNATAYVVLDATSTLTGITASVNGGPFVAIPGPGSTAMPINPGESIQIQATTGPAISTDYTAIVGIGISGNYNYDTWNVTTETGIPSVVTPTIVSPANGATGVQASINTPAGITVTGSTYTPLNGAGPQQSASWQIYGEGYPLVSTSATTAAAGGTYATITSYTSTNGGSQPTKFTKVKPVSNPGPYLWYSPPPYAGFGSGQSKGGTNITFTVDWTPGLTPCANTFSVVTNNNSKNSWPITYTLTFTDNTTISVTTKATKKLNTLTFPNCNNRIPKSLQAVSVKTPSKAMVGYMYFMADGSIISGGLTTLSISGAYTDGFRPGMQIQSSTGPAASGTIISVTDSQIILGDTSGTWATLGGQTIQTPTTSYVVIANVSGDTVNLSSYFIPITSLAPSTTYYARVQYTASTSEASSFSPWSSFTTASTL